MSDVGVFPMLTVEAVTRRGPPTRYSILRRLTILTETMKRPNLGVPANGYPDPI